MMCSSTVNSSPGKYCVLLILTVRGKRVSERLPKRVWETNMYMETPFCVKPLIFACGLLLIQESPLFYISW